MRKLVLMILAVTVIGLGYLGSVKYQEAKLLEAQEKELADFKNSLLIHVKVISIRMGDQLQNEMDGFQGLSYRDVFEKLQESVLVAESQLVDVKVLESPKYVEISRAVVEYIDASRKYFRLTLREHRGRLAIEEAERREDALVDEIKSSTSLDEIDLLERLSKDVFRDHKRAVEDIVAAVNLRRKECARLLILNQKLLMMFSDHILIPEGKIRYLHESHCPEAPSSTEASSSS